MTSRFWTAGGNALLPGSNVFVVAGSVLTPYLGQVATRSAIATTTLAQTKLMSRVAMYATDALTSFKVKFPGWIKTNSAVGVGSAVTYTASIEYPAGTFTQVKWAASASVVAAIGGDTGLSDAIALAVPKGTKFWVRAYATTTASGVPVNGENRWTSGGDACVSSGSATDQTMSGTVTDDGTLNLIFPLCLVQTTTSPSFLLIGDSRTCASSHSQNATGDAGQTASSLGPNYAYINGGQSADTVRNYNTGAFLSAALSPYCSHVIHGYGINDIAPGSGNEPAAKVEGDFIAAAYSMPGKAHIISTVAPDTSSTDSWATLANQTVNANDAARIAFNTWARALPDPFYACIDIAAAVESGGSASPSGKWVVGDTDDGLHQNNTGMNAIISASTIVPATLGASAGLSRFSPLEYSGARWFDANDAAAAGSTPLFQPYGLVSFSLAASSATYGATVFNGGPGYTITGFMDYTNADVSQNAAGIIVGLLATWPTTPAANTAVGGYTTTGSNSAPRAMIMINTSGQPGLAIRRLDADTLVTSYSSTALTAGTPYLFAAVFDPTNGTATLTVNGVSVCTATYGTTGNTSNTTAGFSILNFLGSSGPGFVMGEYVGFNVPSATAAANAAIRQKLEGDMAWRRGAPTTFLPNTHPYYSTRPPA